MTNEELEVVHRLIEELDDAVDFMETLSEWEDDEAEQRRESKEVVVERARKIFHRERVEETC